MNWWLILLVAVVALAIVWYIQQQNARAAQRQADDRRRLQGQGQAAMDHADAEERTALAEASARMDSARPVKQGGGLLQEAADAASGRDYERAAGQLGETTAELAAERLASRASEALAAVQAAAAAHGGAVPGDGTHDCPPGYPVKGRVPAQRYALPEHPSYSATIPDVCFQSESAAQDAGFTVAGDETGVRDGAGEVPPGAVRGDGSRDCPPTYPVKASQASRSYQEPDAPGYATAVPELCFSSAASARTAGLSPAPH